MAEHEEGGGGFYHRLLEASGWGHAAKEAQQVHQATKGFSNLQWGKFAYGAHEAKELSHGLGGTNLSHWLGPLVLANGVNELIHGHGPVGKMQGALEIVSGGTGTLG